MNGERFPQSPSSQSEYQGGMGGSPAAANRHRMLFTAAANAVTKLYRSPDRTRFAAAANSVTNLFREGEVEWNRARCKGSRDSLKECLEWVSRQGMYIDSSQLAHLLKQQIAYHSERTHQEGEVGSEHDTSHGADMPGCGRSFAEELDSVACHTSCANRAGDHLGSWVGEEAGVVSEAPPSSRKRRAEEFLYPFRIDDDETMVQHIPHIWPVKIARRGSDDSGRVDWNAKHNWQ